VGRGSSKQDEQDDQQSLQHQFPTLLAHRVTSVCFAGGEEFAPTAVGGQKMRRPAIDPTWASKWN
jgi:hypothetical protein